MPLLGRFDEAFLAVPPEVIQLTARVNQKYFVCRIPPRASLGEGDRSPEASGGGAGAAGSLANAFVCVANIAAADGGAKIIEGNRKVLAARLADAKFFYETDLKVPLDEQAKKLGQIVFHEKLGTVADKVERIAKLARWLVEEGIVKSSPGLLGEGDHAQHGGGARSEAKRSSVGFAAGPSTTGSAGGPPSLAGEELAALAERAARLAKADLVTGMVGEFPELQGVMGGYYAAAQGEDPRVAAAIRNHYKPIGQGDAVPTDPVTVAVSLADKLDTISSFFAVHERPTGSKDPYALRRAALGAVALILSNGLRLELSQTGRQANHGLIAQQIAASDEIKRLVGGSDSNSVKWGFQQTLGSEPQLIAHAGGEIIPISLGKSESLKIAAMFEVMLGDLEKEDSVLDFFADRLKVQQREAGVRHDLIDAVFALGGEDDLVRLLARVKALQAFIGTEDGANLLTGYRRAANILKKEGWDASSPLPLGEGQGASAPRGEGRGETDADLSSPSHQPSAGGPLPLPKGEGNLGYTPEPEEAALIAALDAAAPAAADAVAREDFEGAMAALATLRAPIDAFFDQVTVNDADPQKRATRLALLARIRDAVHGVADFSKIEG